MKKLKGLLASKFFKVQVSQRKKVDPLTHFFQKQIQRTLVQRTLVQTNSKNKEPILIVETLSLYLELLTHRVISDKVQHLFVTLSYFRPDRFVQLLSLKPILILLL